MWGIGKMRPVRLRLIVESAESTESAESATILHCCYTIYVFC